jgi:hypothetical protein
MRAMGMIQGNDVDDRDLQFNRIGRVVVFEMLTTRRSNSGQVLGL